MLELLADDHLAPFWSSILIDGFGTLGVAIVTALALRHRARQLRDAAAADASTSVNRDLTPGSCVLRGRVEYSQDANWAVRVDVDQDGEDQETSGVWTYKWTEKNRRVHIAPFYVRLESGRRIRIEPSDDVLLVDDMDGVVRIDLKKRTRYAELVPGETIYASGLLVRAPDPENSALTGGYRNAAESLVLRPPASVSMLLSTEPLGARFRARAAFYAGAAKWIVSSAIFLHALFFGFHARRYLGQTENASIERLEHYTTNDEGNEVFHYRVDVQTHDGLQIVGHVPYSVYEQLTPGMQIPIRRIRGVLAKSSTIGSGVTSHSRAWIFPVFLLIAWAAYRHLENTSRPWYERKVNDSGRGRLEDSLAKEQGSSARS